MRETDYQGTLTRLRQDLAEQRQILRVLRQLVDAVTWRECDVPWPRLADDGTVGASRLAARAGRDAALSGRGLSCPESAAKGK